MGKVGKSSKALVARAPKNAEVDDAPSRFTKLFRELVKWLSEWGDGLGELRDDLDTLVRMVKAWKSGRYTDVPYATIAKIVAAIAYIVSPLDLVPDALPVVGLLDDLKVLQLTLSAIAKDIERFEAWERSVRSRRRRGAVPKARAAKVKAIAKKKK